MGNIQINEVYKPLYTSKKRYFLITGGRGSLKSTSVHDFITRLSYESGHGILFTRYTMASAEKSIIPEFIIVATRNRSIADFKITHTRITNKKSGSFILFSGIKTNSGDQTANLKSIPGITTWVIDEGEDFNDEKTFEDIDNSVRSITRQNRVIWIQNPSTREHFRYQTWIGDAPKYIMVEGFKVAVSNLDEIEHIHTTYHIAEDYLSPSFLEKAERIKIKNPEKYYHTYIGGWLDKAEGCIYTDWELGKFDDSFATIHGLDFGSNDPDACTEISIDESKKRIYIREKIFQNGLSTDGLAKLLEKNVGKHVIIIADSAGKRTIRDLWDLGFEIERCRKGPDSVWHGIKTIQGYTLIIDPESINLQKALNNYCWHNKKNNIPNHDWSDLCDSFRYAIMYQIMGAGGGSDIL